jgi:ADP-heptose:LPS heptosyltransferase
MMASEERICIFLTGGLGDFVASLPAQQVIRRGFPRGRILLVGNPLWLPLARTGSLVDEVRSMDDLPLHAGFTNDLPGDHPLSRFIAGFDLIISWFGDREGRWEKSLQRACSGRFLVRPYHRVHDFEGHVSDFYLETLEDPALQGRERNGQEHPPVPLLREEAWTEADAGGDDPVGEGPFLCVHPGSGSHRKNWPKEGFLEVARGAFRRWRLPSSVLLGPAERDQRKFWYAASGPSLFVKEGAPILEAARTLRRAALYVGNDSGITHLAAAVGTPSVALFGPTDPARWAPRGAGVKILGQGNSAQQVLAALAELQEDSSIIL